MLPKVSESVSLDNDEPLLPPPPDVAQNDLLLRLGFLLGDHSAAAQCSTETEALDQCVRSSSSPGMHQESRCASGEHLHDYSSKPSTLSSPEHEGRHDPMNTSPISTIAGILTVIFDCLGGCVNQIGMTFQILVAAPCLLTILRYL